MKERDALFDNIRAILIFCVVLGHLISGRTGENIGIKTLYYYIYFFHMPLFVFVTGYFSKNLEKSRDTAFRNFLVVYIVFDTLFSIWDYFLNKSGTNFFSYYKLIVPKWGMWYPLAVFFWKILAKDMVKIRGILIISLLVGLILPVFPDFGTTLTMGRVIGFLFFFIAGLLFDPKWIEKIKKIPAYVGYLILVGMALVTFVIVKYKWIVSETLYLREPYEKGEKLSQLFMRAEFYVIACIMIFAFLIAISRKKCFLSQIGQNTLTVYLLHLFILRAFNKLDILKGHPFPYLALAFSLAALLTFLLSRPFVKKGYDKGMNIIYRVIYQKRE